MNKHLRRGLVALGAAAALVAGLGTAAVPAHAATEGDDVLLGVFTNSANDGTDTFYMSANGRDFQKISTSFVDKSPNDPGNNEATTSHTAGRNYPVYAQACPSVIWYDNTFWVLSNISTLNNGRAQLIVSASKDLVHWSDPKDLFVSIPGGVKYGNNIVAADWAVDPSTNTPYVVFSAGFYGEFNNKPEQDNMRPYIAKLSLDAKDGFNPAADPKRNDASVLATSAEAAQAINLSNNDRIDGSLYFEGGKAYLAIKRDGKFNEIYQASKPGASGWTKIADNLAVGSEAASIAKLNGMYFLYTDDISSYPGLNGANGTRVSISAGLSGGWSGRQVLNASAPGKNMTVVNHGGEAWKVNGPRHGTVITLTDPAAKQVVWNLYKSTYKSTSSSSFLDVANNHWAFAEGWIDKAVKAGIMGGYNGNFAPDDPLRRGQVAAVLYRIANPSSDATTNPAHYGKDTGFGDGGSQQYYYAAVKWLKDEGIATGDKDVATGASLNRFRPDDKISRQELTTLVYRFAQKMGAKGGADTSKLNQFTDNKEVLPYAREAMAWCNANGIVSGFNGKLAPNADASRGQAAKIFTVLKSDVLKK